MINKKDDLEVLPSLVDDYAKMKKQYLNDYIFYKKLLLLYRQEIGDYDQWFEDYIMNDINLLIKKLKILEEVKKDVTGSNK